MNESALEVVNVISSQTDKEVNIVEGGSSKKITASKGKMNIFVCSDVREDLLKNGWSHRGVVGANVYFKEG